MQIKSYLRLRKISMNHKRTILDELKNQYEKKFSDKTFFDEFFKKYVLDTITDQELLKEINRNDRDIENIHAFDYLDNFRILLRTIRVTLLLEISKDYKEFKRLNKKIQKDKEQIVDVEFENILSAIVKVDTKK